MTFWQRVGIALCAFAVAHHFGFSRGELSTLFLGFGLYVGDARK